MLIFPTLSSGAVAQYPLPISHSTPVEIIRFIDGTDQRFVSRGKALRAWHIQLTSLNESEVYQLEDFFASLQGQFAEFVFPDPYSGETVPNCRLGQSSLITDYVAVGLASANLWVVETNG